MSSHWSGTMYAKSGVVRSDDRSLANDVYGFTFAIRAGSLTMSVKWTNGLCLFAYSGSADEGQYCAVLSAGIASMYAAHVLWAAWSSSTMFTWSVMNDGSSWFSHQFE